jgi:hypothetical protein
MVWQQHTALATWVTPARKRVESWLRSERLCHEEKECRRLAGLGFAISRCGLKVQGQSCSSRQHAQAQRAFHSATLLNYGKVLIASAGDLSTGTFTPTESMHAQRCAALLT